MAGRLQKSVEHKRARGRPPKSGTVAGADAHFIRRSLLWPAMRSAIVPLLTACVLALVGAGCGSDEPVEGNEPDPNDKRAVALDCFTEEAGLEAELVGEQSIQVEGLGGPRVEFFVSGGEAEGQQFKGEAQDAEQVGAALLFVGDGTDDQLEALENCLG